MIYFSHQANADWLSPETYTYRPSRSLPRYCSQCMGITMITAMLVLLVIWIVLHKYMNEPRITIEVDSTSISTSTGNRFGNGNGYGLGIGIGDLDQSKDTDFSVEFTTMTPTNTDVPTNPSATLSNIS